MESQWGSSVGGRDHMKRWEARRDLGARLSLSYDSLMKLLGLLAELPYPFWRPGQAPHYSTRLFLWRVPPPSLPPHQWPTFHLKNLGGDMGRPPQSWSGAQGRHLPSTVETWAGSAGLDQGSSRPPYWRTQFLTLAIKFCFPLRTHMQFHIMLTGGDSSFKNPFHSPWVVLLFYLFPVTNNALQALLVTCLGIF